MSRRSERRRIRRVLSANISDYVVGNEDGASMLAHTCEWLAKQPGFARTSSALRTAVIIDLLSRELCEFRHFTDNTGVEGIHLADATGRSLSLAILYCALLRARMKGSADG